MTLKTSSNRARKRASSTPGKPFRVIIEGETEIDSHVLGYKNEFKQVILNLLNNAADAIIERYQRGELAGGEGCLRVWITDRGGAFLAVSIEDNGGGIPETIREKIFEPYFSTKEATKGTGIGLYMSKTIIEESMDGKLHCNVSGDNTTFVIELKKA